jgi:CheY-like chemotaxis protein
MLSNILNKAGIFEIDSAFDGQDGVDKTRLKHYDIVLMDLNMPTMNGDEAVKLIRKEERKD